MRKPPCVNGGFFVECCCFARFEDECRENRRHMYGEIPRKCYPAILFVPNRVVARVSLMQHHWKATFRICFIVMLFPFRIWE